MSTISLSGAVLIPLPISLRGDYSKNGQGDTGYISGLVTEQGVPVVMRVFCYHRLTGLLIESKWSNDDGSYRFDNLVAGVKYYITSIDENNDGTQYNAVTQDLIVASEVAQ